MIEGAFTKNAFPEIVSRVKIYHKPCFRMARRRYLLTALLCRVDYVEGSVKILTNFFLYSYCSVGQTMRRGNYLVRREIFLINF